MKRNSKIRGSQVLAAALLMSLFFIATSQAQTDLVVFAGKFTLTDKVLWGETVLQPGDYTITIGSTRMPTFALVRDGKGRPVARFASGIEKDGQLRLYSLALRTLGRVLVYDPALAREAILEARSPQTVPVMLAKR